MKKRIVERWTSIAFLVPPIFVSVVSVAHVYGYLTRSYSPFAAIMLAISYEIMVLSMIIIGSRMSILGWFSIALEWFIVAMLGVILAFANVFSAWEGVQSNTITSISLLLNIVDGVPTKRIFSFFNGVPVTILSLTFIPMYALYRRKLKEGLKYTENEDKPERRLKQKKEDQEKMNIRINPVGVKR